MRARAGDRPLAEPGQPLRARRGRPDPQLGAEIIIQPTLTTTRDREMELVCARANAWTNQVYVVNVNASYPAGVGASAIVDPEGIVRQQAGTGEEILVDVLDLDTVTRVREQGLAGLNRPWTQLARYGERIHLPVYGGTFRTPEWSQNQLPGQAASFGSPR
ncbi:carbon-nitrogen hydrolase family protein [Streptomyces sp. NPDC005904]|uniref:carbon-nitrogen hydrolase family protein n=1 Tax=Streptomyces sp. NPDC005904 TaxID=3154570 RepID=UPI0033EDA156